MKEIEVSENTLVRVCRLPSKTHRVEVNPGDNVEIVVTNATGQGLQPGEQAAVNGQPATAETPVPEGATVVISKGAKGAI